MILAIDTSTRFASLALHDGQQVWAESTWYSSDHHTVELMPSIALMLQRMHRGPADLNGVAVALGPGSFTGLRVGIAAAKGLVLAQNLPLVGVPTLDVIAASQGHQRMQLCAVIQAGRGRLAAGFYQWERNRWRSQGEPLGTTWAELLAMIGQPTLFSGEIDPAGAQAIKKMGAEFVVAPPAANLRRAGYLADLAWNRFKSGNTDNPATLAPIYLPTAGVLTS